MIRPLLLVVLLLLGICTTKAVPPNVVLIVSDDHAWGDYGFMGHATIKTPHLDRLAQESLTFRRGYVPSSLCCPSLASIISGKYPHQHRVTSNDPPLPPGIKGTGAALKNAEFVAARKAMNAQLAEHPLLPGLLAGAGYRSFQSGKWWQGHFSTGGFTHGMTLGDESKGGRHGDDGLAIGRKTMQPIYDFIAGAQKENAPFFVWYAPMMPHDPHTPPQRILEKYLPLAPSVHIARYWAMVEWFDETCGALLAHLDEKGLRENTIVAYVTDNGWIQNQDDTKFAPKSKQSPYDGGLRTPIMVRWPGKIQPAMSDTPVSSLDLFPTLLRAAGVEVPGGVPGLDLRDATALAARKRLFGECFTHNAVEITRPATSLRWRWVLEDRWKLILPAPQQQPGEKPELYDVLADPNETRDLSAQHAEIVSRLSAEADQWWPGRD